LRTISDAYTDVARQLSKSAPAGDTRDALTTVRYGKDQLRRIAATVDAETAARAHAAATALVIALSPSSDGNPLSLQDRKLLRLLVSGNTIEEIASQLQVSRRTVHRRLHAVWDQAGASSRTEGIAIVSARGWLD
ncbi:MAG: LuxR C-terminal-related transcriptional regulator, partial [Acidimicrobiia bacterium]|nr:LuxR C-terminal-related transcriptional regulator [Acidimicrobiia bacterium]